MYLKGYAILAAVSQQHQQQQQHPPTLQHQAHNATVMSTATATATTTTTPTTAAAAAATTMLSTALPVNDDELEDELDEPLQQSQEHGTSSSSSSITTYYNGGMGLYNQQRGGAGGISLFNGIPSSSTANGNGNSHGGAIGGGSGGSQPYAHVVNGSVNLLLGGSMLCLVTTILCVVCYCCHRNIKKRTEAAYRQQQHQWLENDPNMEIYSVEQCYETSGLFLGDSTDGLAAMPGLHHEPPPSYDAVVLHEQQLLQQQQQQLEEQQLQLQQQQLLLQRVSPPPGYRSTLDISCLQQAAAATASPSVAASSDAIASGSGSGSSNNSASNAVAAAGSESLVNKQLQRTLNAQSCCSLQRAEVENMWNAAAAAVVARSGPQRCQDLEMYMTTASPPLPLPLALQQARKNAQAAMRLNSFGRRYLQQSQHMQQHSHYRRGCPLCGKFRYPAEDEMLAAAASIESGLEQCDDNDNDNDNENENPNENVASVEELPQSTSNGNQIDAQADAANGNVVESEAAAMDENDNATEQAVAVNSADANLDMSNINENGIISLDMSKIIDISGLPTYEGALKLESSGYV